MALTETEIRKSIRDTLRLHPLVARVIVYGSGKMGRLRCNDADGHPDIGGYLINGKAFYLEVKKNEADSKRKDERNKRQLEFIEHAKKFNVIASIVWTVEKAVAIIEQRDQ